MTEFYPAPMLQLEGWTEPRPLSDMFSYAGGSQFARDMHEVWRVLGDGGENAMAKVAEACILLTLPVEGGERVLRDVVKPVFADNVQARECMGKLGIKELAVSDVRNILQRRVEAFGGN